MNRRSLATCALLAIGIGGASVARAESKAEVLVEQRQAAMTLQGKYFGALAAMAKGKVPYDAKAATRYAEFLDTLSKMPWDGFDASTKGVKSDALPAVFSNPTKFKEASERLQAEIAKLVATSKGGNEAAVKAQIDAVGKACGSCHDEFRVKD